MARRRHKPGDGHPEMFTPDEYSGAPRWMPPETFPDLSAAKIIAVDTETCDPHLLTHGPGGARDDGYIVGVSVAVDDWQGYFPVAHEGGGNLDAEIVKEWLTDMLTTTAPLVGANLKYDLEWLRHAGVRYTGPFYDIQWAEALLDADRQRYSLNSLAETYCGTQKDDGEMAAASEILFGAGNVGANIWRLPAHHVGRYAEQDARLALNIFKIQQAQLRSQGLWKLFKMESALTALLIDMRFRGVRVDVDRAEKMVAELKILEAREINKISQVSGVRPDIWAAESVARVFDALGVSYPRTAKTRAPSFQAKWLEQHPHPVAQSIRSARQMGKLRGTFLEGAILEKNVNGRIHGQFHPLRSEGGGTISGRFSSSLPNLQNIPKHGDMGKRMRGIFIPEDGCDWWKCDWSQIEYRFIVHYAYRRGMPRADLARDRYLNDPTTDFHEMVAEFASIDRDSGKTLNFGMAYGMGRVKMAARLGVSLYDADILLGRYHMEVPFVKTLINEVSNIAERRGYVKTILGRRQRFNYWEATNRTEGLRLGREAAEQAFGKQIRRAKTHKALNSVIQGSAADLMKLAMVKTYESGVYDVLGIPALTVHDELDGSAPRTKAGKEALAEVQNIMETCMKLEVPILADMETGKNWGNVKKFDAKVSG